MNYRNTRADFRNIEVGPWKSTYQCKRCGTYFSVDVEYAMQEPHQHHPTCEGKKHDDQQKI